MSPPTNLDSRRAPGQARSRATVDAVYRAFAELIAEKGIHPVSMTDIARRCRVSKAALYRYFPHKPALIRALAVSVMEEDRDRLLSYLKDETRPPRAVLSEALRDYCQHACKDSFRTKLKLAMHADDELSALDFKDSQANARALARYLRGRGVKVALPELERRALLVLELIDGLIRVMLQVGRRRQAQLLDDFIDLAGPYLLDGAPGFGASDASRGSFT